MKIKVYSHAGFVGTDREDIIEVGDDEVEGMTEQEKADYLDKYTRDWAFEHFEWGWDEVDD